MVLPPFWRQQEVPLFPNMEALWEEADPQAEAERTARELEEADRVEPDAAPMATARKRAAYRFRAPNLLRPVSFTTIEVGLATLSGFGRHTVRFEGSFSNTPYALYSAFGFFEVRLPVPRVQWRYFRVGWRSVSIPVPTIEWVTLRLPTLVFLMNVRKDSLELFNVAGTTNVVYFVMGE